MYLTYILHWVLISARFQICDSYGIIFITVSISQASCISTLNYMSPNLKPLLVFLHMVQCRHLNIATHKHQKVNINVVFDLQTQLLFQMWVERWLFFHIRWGRLICVKSPPPSSALPVKRCSYSFHWLSSGCYLPH